MEGKRLVYILENYLESVSIGWKTKAFLESFVVVLLFGSKTEQLGAFRFEPLIGPTYELDAFHKLIIKDGEMLGDLPGLRTKLCDFSKCGLSLEHPTIIVKTF